MMHDDISRFMHEQACLFVAVILAVEVTDTMRQISVERIQHLTYGQGPRGSTRLRKAVASFINTEFGARDAVTYDQIIVMSGVTSIIDSIAWSICNEGDGILIPQPFYTGYQIDINQRARGELIPVPFLDVEGYESLDDVFKSDVVRKAFEAQLARTRERGGRATAVLLTK